MRIAALICCCLPLQQAEREVTFNFTSYEMDAIFEYLLPPGNREQYGELSSDEERRRFLYRFWMEFDPSPETPEYNELMLHFLRRVELANFLYGFDGGWSTDRGKVLIFFGPPAEIRRSRFGPSSGPKHEIWIYRSEAEDGGGTQLIFEDELDSGEFVLRTAIVYPEIPSLTEKNPSLAENGDEEQR